LYDLKSDPQEMNNLYDHPEYQDKVAELKAELTRLQTDLGDDPVDIGDNPNIGELDEVELELYWEESDD